MANTDSAKGFVPIRNPHGNTVPIEEYQAATAITISPGQILYINGSGLVRVYTGTATGRLGILGAAQGWLAAANADRAILVSDDRDQEYEVQVDDATLTNLGLLVGQNFAAVNLTTASTTRLVSLAEIDGDSGVGTNNSTTIRPFRAIRYSKGTEGVDASSSWVNIVVKINDENHVFNGPTGLT
jgi:hypothetical protein